MALSVSEEIRALEGLLATKVVIDVAKDKLAFLALHQWRR